MFTTRLRHSTDKCESTTIRNQSIDMDEIEHRNFLMLLMDLIVMGQSTIDKD